MVLIYFPAKHADQSILQITMLALRIELSLLQIFMRFLYSQSSLIVIDTNHGGTYAMIVNSTARENSLAPKYVTDRTIGAQVRKIRKLRKLSIEKLAARIKISAQQLQKIEAGLIASSGVIIAALALELDRPISDFFLLDELSMPDRKLKEYSEDQLRGELDNISSNMNIEQLRTMVLIANALTCID